jgi:PAS domain S-box-containing protein
MKNIMVEELEKEIAERKQTEESMLLFNNLVNHSNDAIFVNDPSTGLFLIVNDKACTSLGYSRPELLTLRPIDIATNFKDQSSWDAHVSELKLKGHVVTEGALRRKDGTSFPIEVTVTYVKLNDNDYMVAMVRDITERKKREQELVESEERFRGLIEKAPVAISISRAGKTIYVNNKYLALYGFQSLDEVVGQPIFDQWAPESREIVRERAEKRLLGEPVSSEYEGTGQRKDGSQFPVHIFVESVELPDGPAFMAFLSDITERRRAEQELEQHREHLQELVEMRTSDLSIANKKLKELDRLKSMFIASMSHELRTPLNSIIGFTGMTLQGMSGELNDEQKDNLNRAFFSAKHLLALITDVIDISKIEAGRVEVFPEAFSLREVVDDALANIEPQLKDRGLGLEVDVSHAAKLYTDKRRLLQCLINLLSNAVKYSEHGMITVTSLIDNEQAVLSVVDTGIGIAEKEMTKLFEPFERLDTHLRVKAGGTGLGLYLTKKLVTDVLQGSISVTSIEGQGSTFIITVPMDISTLQKFPGDIL